MDDDNDTETFKILKKKKVRKQECGDDFMSIIIDVFKGINWKMALFLFIMMTFVFSDLYVNVFLESIDNTVYGDIPNTKGTFIQIVTITLGYIILDLLIKGEIL